MSSGSSSSSTNASHGGINARAQTGFAKSAAYDQHRATYPAASVQELLEQTRVAGKHGAKVIDLAAGTGIFTQALAAREEAYNIVAVEPHDDMRNVLAGKQLPRVEVLAGKAGSIPVEDESVDAVIVAQAFHWFANDDSLNEIYRVLKPHGCLGLIWNIEDYNAPRSQKPTTAWEGKVQDLTWTFDDNEPRFRHERWRKVFDDQLKSTPLSLIVASDPKFALPLGEHRESFTVWLTKEGVWERYSTISHIAIQEGEDREKTYKTVKDALDGPEVETNEKGQVAVHGTTYAVWTSKVPADGRENLTDVDTSA